MKVRFGMTLGIILVLIGVVSLLAGAASKTGTVTAGVATVFDVTMPSNTVAFGNITTDVNGVTLDNYLQLGVNSNVTYTVQLSCSGNLNLVGKADNGVNEIETEYAVWKSIDWYDWHSQQAAPHHAEGYVDDAGQWAFSGNTTPTWFEAEVEGGGVQGGNVYPETGLNQSQQDFSGPFYLPEHSASYVWWYDASWGGVWNPNWYNHGADLTLKIYPYLDVFEHYGTRAGSYSGSFTIVVTSVNSSVP